MNYLPGVGQTGVLSYDSCRQVVWSSIKVSELTRIEFVSLPKENEKTYTNNVSAEASSSADKSGKFPCVDELMRLPFSRKELRSSRIV
jgi:hypothetical protein